MNPQERDISFAEDILKYIDIIERFVTNINDISLIDEKLNMALYRCLAVIGEAGARMSKETKAEYAEVPWRQIANMANRIVHDYNHIQLPIIWETIQSDLPILKMQMRRILNELNNRFPLP